MFPRINHQQQPTHNTCVSTSIAMVLDLPAESVIERWHVRYFEGNASLREIFNDYGIKFTSFDSCDRQSLENLPSGRLLLVVPSLNTLGNKHQIVAEWNEPEGTWSIFDPQAGTGNKYFDCIENPEDPNCVKLLGGYDMEAFISFEDLAEWKRNR